MTLKTKVDGAWKEAQSLHVKINGEWKDVSTLYSKKDGAWVTVYSSGALITFTGYPYPIPVAKGWKYSTDGITWTTVSADGEINTSGTFTGFIKANSITLNDYYTEHIEAQEGARMDGQSLSTTRRVPVSFVNNGKGYVCTDTTDVYDISGNRTSGKPPITNANGGVSFILSDKAYLCAGFDSGTTVSVYDSFGNVTTGNNIAYSKGNKATAFVNGNKGYVCGGQSYSGYSEATYVGVFDISGNVTSGTPISEAKAYPCSFVNNSKGYVCSGYNNVNINSGSTVVDVYDSSGNRTTGQSLSAAFVMASTFVNDNKGYVCAGGKFSIPSNTVNIYDSSGNMTVGQALSVRRYDATAFVLNNKGYVCGGSMNPGYQSVVDVYDTSGNRTLGNELSAARCVPTSFVNGDKGYVCGGIETDADSSVVDVYYDQAESYTTKLPITEGSTYTLNGESGVADTSKVMEFDSKVTGTIKYKEGDMSPSVRITVVDESGNVVEGATISFGDMSPSVRITVVDESGNVVEGATISFGDAPFTWITNTNRTWIDNVGNVYDATGDGKNIYDSSVESKIGRIEMTYVRTGKGTHTLSVTSTDGLFNGGMGGITPSLWSPAIDTSTHGSGTLTIKVYGKLGTLVQTVDFTVQMSNEPS